LSRAVGEIEIAEVDLIATEPGNSASQTLARIAVEDVLVASSTPKRSRSSRHRCPRSDFMCPLRCDVSKRAGVSTTALTLVAGDHRLAAVKSLGWTQIDADETDARIWQLMENLYRAELTPLQRAEHVAELVQLVRDGDKGVQVAHPGGQQPHDRGISRAAKILGFTREEVRRSQAIAGISEEAKEKAKEIGLDKKQSALLKIANENESKAQLAKIEEIKASKPTSVPKASSTGAANKKKTKTTNEATVAAVKAPLEPDTGTGEDASGPPLVPEEDFPDLPASDENERLFVSLKAAWDSAPRAVRKRFVTEVLGADIEV
jgi:hypothetical protein